MRAALSRVPCCGRPLKSMRVFAQGFDCASLDKQCRPSCIAVRIRAHGSKAMLRKKSRTIPTHACCRRVPRRPIMPQPGGCEAALHRRHRMVRQMLHEHETALSAASHANRSRRLIKCAKEFARYPEIGTPSAFAVLRARGPGQASGYAEPKTQCPGYREHATSRPSTAV